MVKSIMSKTLQLKLFPANDSYWYVLTKLHM